MGRDSLRLPSLQPHPATFILFRPPSTPNDDEVFTSDLVTSSTRSLNYKKSCPALMGTASRRLERINEDLYDDEESSTSDENGSPVSYKDHFEPGAYHGGQTLSKKRSFLLVDVIDNLEGRPPPKKQDTHDSASVISTGSVEIAGPQTRGRSLARHRSTFDLLYNSSKENACRPHSPPTNRTETISGELELGARRNMEPVPARGRQPGLRSKKSMIALSIERNRSTSPSKSRLNEMDTQQITSFDALFEDSNNNLKADPSLKPVDIGDSTALATMPALETASRPLERVPIKRNFSRQTALLMQMPQERPTTKHARQLRHTKSAKDILQSYSPNRPQYSETCPDTNKKAQGTSAIPTKTELRASKRAAKQASLRDDLRSLLGMKKKKASV